MPQNVSKYFGLFFMKICDQGVSKKPNLVTPTYIANKITPIVFPLIMTSIRCT